MLSKKQFLKRDTELESDSEFCTEFNIHTSTDFKFILQKNNTFLASFNPQEQLFDRSSYGAFLHCKTLRQIDLFEYRKNHYTISSNLEPDGAKQILYAINSSRSLVTAIKQIADRDLVGTNALT